MTTRTHSADPRAERVRNRLREAAFALAHERPVDQLTVGDIVSRAEVSRQVFYRHFRDRDDAVATAIAVEFASATATLHSDGPARIVALFDFAGHHRSMYRNVVSSTVARSAIASFRDELLPACQLITSAAMPAITPISAVTPEAVTRFLVGGFTEVLRSWMEDPDSTDLPGRVNAALATVNALLDIPAAAKGSVRHAKTSR